MNTLRFRTAAAALLSLAATTLASAHGGDGSGDAADGIGLGLAVGTERKPYRDFDDKTEALPLLRYENRWIRLFGPSLDLKLGTTGPVSYALTASYARDGYKPGDSPFLEGMDKRRAGIWLGGRATLASDLANVSLAWQGDASGHSHGQKVSIGLERRFAFGDFGLSPHAQATWLDRKFVRYYYGVTAAEVRAGRPAYDGKATVNGELGLRLDWRLAPKHLLFFDDSATALGAAIERSPLVDRSTVPELRLGWMTRF